MKGTVLLAFYVWAIDCDALSLPVEKCWEMFRRDAWSCYKTYTNPNDELFCANLVGKDPIEVMADYTLSYAKMYVISGVRNYGKYDNYIKSYTR